MLDAKEVSAIVRTIIVRLAVDYSLLFNKMLLSKNTAVSSRLKDDSDGAARTVSGKSSHTRDPATGNERSSTVTNLDHVVSRMSISADDRSRRLDSNCETRCRVTDNCGARS